MTLIEYKSGFHGSEFRRHEHDTVTYGMGGYCIAEVGCELASVDEMKRDR